MPVVILRPYVLSLKNRWRQQLAHRHLGRAMTLPAIVLFVMLGVHFGTLTFFEKISLHPQYSPLLLATLVQMISLTFFVLLVFSSLMAALGVLFSSKDLPLLLSSPVSHGRIYFARLLQVAVNSTWMFFLLAVPAVTGTQAALHLPWTFLFAALGAFIPYVVIPAALGVILITLFVNIVPPHRIRELMVAAAVSAVWIIIYVHYSNRGMAVTDRQKMDELVHLLTASSVPQASWLPSTWASVVLNSFILPASVSPGLSFCLLVCSACAMAALGYLVFDCLFLRGWVLSTQGSRTLSIRSSNLSVILGRLLIPFNSQLRAICYKEARMFLRDTYQSLQLVLLLLLTFIYLYNFRALRSNMNLQPDLLSAWQVMLSLANSSFGASVVAAVAARFVFPSVSMEGRAYYIVRCAPLSLKNFLLSKFWTWFWPICILCLILLVSGTLSIFASVETVFASAGLAVALSIGIVGLGVGSGAVCARFDWESPNQVSASLGSLVYMLLSLGLIMVTMLPSIPVFVLTCVPSVGRHLGGNDYLLVMVCSFILIFYLNCAAARHALRAGVEKLQELEQ